MFPEALKAARILLSSGVETDILSLRFLKPFDADFFASLAENYGSVIVVEDGVRPGGIGEHIESVVFERNLGVRVRVMAFPDRFIPQGTREEIFEDCAVSFRDIAGAASEEAEC